MKIAVLSRNPRLYSTRRLVEAGTQRGHEMVVIDTLRAYMNIASHKPQKVSTRSSRVSVPRSPSTAAQSCASSR